MMEQKISTVSDATSSSIPNNTPNSNSNSNIKPAVIVQQQQHEPHQQMGWNMSTSSSAHQTSNHHRSASFRPLVIAPSPSPSSPNNNTNNASLLPTPAASASVSATSYSSPTTITSTQSPPPTTAMMVTKTKAGGPSMSFQQPPPPLSSSSGLCRQQESALHQERYSTLVPTPSSLATLPSSSSFPKNTSTSAGQIQQPMIPSSITNNGNAATTTATTSTINNGSTPNIDLPFLKHLSDIATKQLEDLGSSTSITSTSSKAANTKMTAAGGTTTNRLEQSLIARLQQTHHHVPTKPPSSSLNEDTNQSNAARPDYAFLTTTTTTPSKQQQQHKVPSHESSSTCTNATTISTTAPLHLEVSNQPSTFNTGIVGTNNTNVTATPSIVGSASTTTITTTTPPIKREEKKPTPTNGNHNGTTNSNNNNNNNNGKSKKDRSNLRKGKWTVEEEEYTSRVIHYFRSGLLTLPDGMTLRSYLAKKLSCDPMRITKKFAGASCLGKRVYHLCERSQVNINSIEMARAELGQLEQRFRLRVEHGQSGIPLPSTATTTTATTTTGVGGVTGPAQVMSTTPTNGSILEHHSVQQHAMLNNVLNQHPSGAMMNSLQDPSFWQKHVQQLIAGGSASAAAAGGSGLENSSAAIAAAAATLNPLILQALLSQQQQQLNQNNAPWLQMQSPLNVAWLTNLMLLSQQQAQQQQQQAQQQQQQRQTQTQNYNVPTNEKHFTQHLNNNLTSSQHAQVLNNNVHKSQVNIKEGVPINQQNLKVLNVDQTISPSLGRGQQVDNNKKETVESISLATTCQNSIILPMVDTKQLETQPDVVKNVDTVPKGNTQDNANTHTQEDEDAGRTLLDFMIELKKNHSKAVQEGISKENSAKSHSVPEAKFQMDASVVTASTDNEVTNCRDVSPTIKFPSVPYMSQMKYRNIQESDISSSLSTSVSKRSVACTENISDTSRGDSESQSLSEGNGDCKVDNGSSEEDLEKETCNVGPMRKRFKRQSNSSGITSKNIEDHNLRMKALGSDNRFDKRFQS